MLTHILVVYNRNVDRGASRGRFFQADCEFLHGSRPRLRKFPNVRQSVWGDDAADPQERYGMPDALPRENTDLYPDFSEGGGSAIHSLTDLRGHSPARTSEPEAHAESSVATSNVVIAVPGIEEEEEDV